MSDEWVVVSDKNEFIHVNRGTLIHVEYPVMDMPDTKSSPSETLNELMTSLQELQCKTFTNAVNTMMKELNETGHGTNLGPKRPRVVGSPIDTTGLLREFNKLIDFLSSRDSLTPNDTFILTEYVKKLKHYIETLPVIETVV